jgi:hypothetical protein
VTEKFYKISRSLLEPPLPEPDGVWQQCKGATAGPQERTSTHHKDRGSRQGGLSARPPRRPAGTVKQSRALRTNVPPLNPTVQLQLRCNGSARTGTGSMGATHPGFEQPDPTFSRKPWRSTRDMRTGRRRRGLHTGLLRRAVQCCPALAKGNIFTSLDR